MARPDSASGSAASPTATSLTLFTPAGVLAKTAPLRLAAKRLKGLGFDVRLDEAALARHQRFAGDDATRLAALHRVADAAPSIAMATRGGYGMTRLLDAIDWPRLARAVDRGTRWVGYSDITALHLGLLTHGRRPGWAGPLAVEDFGREDAAGGLDDVTVPCFTEAMSGELEAVGFRTETGFDGLERKGLLWGGNLEMLCSMLGTRHFPRPAQVKGGILFLEDVNVHPYRVERCLLQLYQAGVLERQSAVLLGQFTAWRASPLDRGYGLKQAVQALRSRCTTPILTGLPFGHVPTHVTLPHGLRATLGVQGRDAFVGW